MVTATSKDGSYSTFTLTKYVDHEEKSCSVERGKPVASVVMALEDVLP